MIYLCKMGLLTTVFISVLAGERAFADYSLADKSEVSRFFGTDHVKLAFVSGKKLYFVDFSEVNPRVQFIASISNPCYPVISSQGNLVTYACGKNLCTDPPNNSESAAFACDLLENAVPMKVDSPAFVPRFVQNAAEPTIVYSTSGGGNLADTHYVWNGYGNVYTKNIISGAKTLLWGHGSWYGGLSWDGNWLSTAENRKNAFLLNSFSSTQPVRLHNLKVIQQTTKKDTIISFQTCNPSISSSRLFSDAMMYLDAYVITVCQNNGYAIPGFGEDDGWESHARIFISRSNGKIVRHYSKPSLPVSLKHGMVSGCAWGYPEWSNHPYYAAATLEVSRWDTIISDEIPNHERVYAINLKDSTYQLLIKLSDTSFSMLKEKSVRWPWVWVKTPDNFDKIEDSSWLNTSVAVINHGKKGKGGMIVKNNILTSGINDIRFYTLAGKLVATEMPSQGSYRMPLKGTSGVMIAKYGNKHLRIFIYR